MFTKAVWCPRDYPLRIQRTRIGRHEVAPRPGYDVHDKVIHIEPSLFAVSGLACRLATSRYDPEVPSKLTLPETPLSEPSN